MILTQEQHFENEINANPRDQEVRQAYADWLTEHDREEEGRLWQATLHKYPCINGIGICLGWYGVYLDRENKDPFCIPTDLYILIPRRYTPFVSFVKLVWAMQKLDYTTIP